VSESFRALAFLALLIAIILPPAINLPVTDRDEARFAQASKQMMETGNYVDIRFQEQARYKKPAGSYWLQVLSVKLFSNDLTEIFFYRLPSILAVLAAAILVFRFAQDFVPRNEALLAGFLFALHPITISQAVLARADAALLLTMLASQLALFKAYRAHEGQPQSPLVFFGFWVPLAASIMIKGPVGVVVPLLTAAYLWVFYREYRYLKRLRPLLGIAVLLVLVAPWFIVMQTAGSGNFVSTAIKQDLIPKLIGGQESHGAPPGYYLLVVGLLCVPVLASIASFPKWFVRHFNDREFRFLMAWLVPSWIMFELVPTKLPHYTLPLLPALYILYAAFVRDARFSLVDRAGQIFAAALFAALCVAGIVISLRFNHIDLLGFAIVAALFFGGSYWLFRQRNQVANFATGNSLLVALALSVAVGQIFPRIDQLWLSRQMEDVLRRQGVNDAATVSVQGYGEPSAVFLTGTKILLSNNKNAVAERIRAHRGGFVWCADPTFCESLAHDLGDGYDSRRLDQVKGLNYTKGDELTLTLVRYEART